MKVFEAVKLKQEKSLEMRKLRNDFETAISLIKEIISKCDIVIGDNKLGLNTDKIELAKSIIYVKGNPYGESSDYGTNGGFIGENAIVDIANDFLKMKTRYFGNKTYSGYYQREDHEYGMCPRHGSMVDEIGLLRSARDRQPFEFTAEEKDACIYYLQNYSETTKPVKE